MAYFYNNQNEQRKKELQKLYNDNIQMQQYTQNKQNAFDKAGSMLGTANNAYNKYKLGSSIAGSFGKNFGGNAMGNAGGAMGGVGGAATAAQGAMSVGSDLQRGDYTNAGLDTAKTAASFFGPWGMAAAAAIQMYQNFRSAKQKKAQEAAIKGMEELQKSEQQSNEKKAQAMQGIEQQNAQNEAEVEAMAQQPTSNEIKQDIAGQVLYPQSKAADKPNMESYLSNITGVNEQQQTAPQGSYNVSNSQMSSSPVAQEIMSQIQQPDYSNYNSPYSYEEIQQEMMRRGMR